MENILLVEDDPFLIDIYRQKFKKAGFNLEVVTDGKDALKEIKQKKPDLLLLDIVLPEVDGWEILREVRKTPTLRKLKVLVLSNLGQKEQVEKALELGALKYLIKANYTPSQIVNEVKKALKL